MKVDDTHQQFYVLSQENNIDLTLVEGTGRGGRITRKDLLAIIESGEMPKAAAPVQEVAEPTKAAPVQPPKTEVPVMAGDIEIPVTGVRRAIAN